MMGTQPPPLHSYAAPESYNLIDESGDSLSCESGLGYWGHNTNNIRINFFGLSCYELTACPRGTCIHKISIVSPNFVANRY